MSMRRFLALLEGLPVTSATVRAADERAGMGWTVDTDLLALIAEVLDHGNAQQYMIHSKKGTQPPKPINIPRPGDEERRRKRRIATPEEIKEIFSGGMILRPQG